MTDKIILLGSEVIKGLNISVGEELSKFSNNNYETFIDLYLDLIENSNLKSAQIGKMVELDIFDEFGSSSDLSWQLELLKKYSKRKTLNKIKLIDTPFDEKDVKKFSNKETKKMYRDIDMLSLIKVTVKKQEKRKTHKIDILKSESELLGMPLKPIIDENTPLKDSLAYVYLIEFPNWGRGDAIVSLFRLASGEVANYRVYQNNVLLKTLKQGDLIRTISQKETYNFKGMKENILVAWNKVKKK